MLKSYKNIFTDIKKLLDSSIDPLFIFDRDPDGLCSYVILKSYVNSGNGIFVKGGHNVDISYLRDIKKFNPDKIFILDISKIDQEFIDRANKQIILIDHHPIKEFYGVKYFNPLFFNKRFPVTYVCYKATNSKLWVAMLGSIADFHYPDFAAKFRKLYPGLLDKKRDPAYIIYNTKLGELIRIISFNLKGSLKDVREFVNIFENINDPYEILDKKTPNGKIIYQKFNKVNKIYTELLNEALSSVTIERVFCFTYAIKKYSFSSELSNELYYKLPNKLVIIGREKNDEMILSLRSKRYNVRNMLKGALKNVEGYGGGHISACGAVIKKKDFSKFIELMKRGI